MLFLISINRTHDIIYVSSCISNQSFKHFPCDFLQIDVLYQVPSVIYYESVFFISYCKCSCVSIIHNIRTWYNIVLNTKVVTIYWHVVLELSTSIIISFPQVLHIIAIFCCIFLNPPPVNITTIPVARTRAPLVW